jgi:hypothetical protein
LADDGAGQDGREAAAIAQIVSGHACVRERPKPLKSGCDAARELEGDGGVGLGQEIVLDFKKIALRPAGPLLPQAHFCRDFRRSLLSFRKAKR